MKILLATILAIASAAVARAGADFNFSPAIDGTYKCITYCVGFATDSADTVDYVNVQWYSTASGYKVTLKVNGDTYQGFARSSGDQFTAQGVTIDGVTGISYTGTYALVTLNWWVKRTCTTSGRVPHCTTWNFATSGSVQ